MSVYRASYPYFSIAKWYGLDYADVLALVGFIEKGLFPSEDCMTQQEREACRRIPYSVRCEIYDAYSKEQYHQKSIMMSAPTIG